MARRGFGNALLGGAAPRRHDRVGYEGVYSMEIVKADDAVFDEDALRSGSVQGALNEFKSYAVGVVRLREVLNNDNQFDVGKVLKKEYDYVKEPQQLGGSVDLQQAHLSLGRGHAARRRPPHARCAPGYYGGRGRLQVQRRGRAHAEEIDAADGEARQARRVHAEAVRLLHLEVKCFRW